MIELLSYNLAKFNKHFAVIAMLFLIIMAYHFTIPEIESDLAGYNVDNNPYDLTAGRMAETFNSGNVVQVLVRTRTGDAEILFTGLQEVREEIEKSFPGSRIESIDNAQRLLFRRAGAERSVRDILIAALDIPLVTNLVSRDTASFLLIVSLDNAESFDPDIFDSIINKSYNGIESLMALSRFHVQRVIERSIARDYMILLPVIMILFTALLLLTYRSFSAVAICLINISISFIPVLFFLSIFKVSINQITAPAIPIVAILSLSASIHLITGYLHQGGLIDKTLRVQKTLARYFVPSLLSSLTTAIAFGSFILSDSYYLRQFGLVTACSVITAFILVFLITPFTLRMAGKRKFRGIPENFTCRMESLIMSHKMGISIVFILLLIFSAFLVPSVRFHANLESYIPKNTGTSETTIAIKEAFHSLAEIDMLIEINPEFEGSGGFIPGRLELIAVTRNLAETIAAYPEVSSVQSFADQLDFEKQHSLPGFSAIIFSRSRNPFVSSDQLKYRINIKIANADDIRIVASRIATDFSIYEPVYAYSIYSDFLFFNFINSSLTASLLRSLLLSSVLIIFILLILSRNLAFTLISILANLPPLGFLIIIFVIGGIDLNMTTSISLVVCLGLIVDDTIHILYRRVRLASPIGELGFGILTTSLILTAGFLSFLLSQSIPNQIFGVLCAVVFFFAAISDLAVISWLSERMRLKTGDGTTFENNQLS